MAASCAGMHSSIYAEFKGGSKIPARQASGESQCDLKERVAHGATAVTFLKQNLGGRHCSMAVLDALNSNRGGLPETMHESRSRGFLEAMSMRLSLHHSDCLVHDADGEREHVGSGLRARPAKVFLDGCRDGIPRVVRAECSQLAKSSHHSSASIDEMFAEQFASKDRSRG